MVLPRKRRQTKMSNGYGSLEANKWTATRCHRLLRPLISQIVALQKELAWPSSEAMECQSHGFGGADSTLFSAVEPQGSPRRVKSKLTYSSKASKRHPLQTRKARKIPVVCTSSKAATSEAFACSKTAMPTPVARKIRAHQLSSPVAVSSWSESGVNESIIRPTQVQAPIRGRKYYSLRSSAHDELVKLRPTIRSNIFTILDSILRTFESLLQATAEPADYFVSKKSMFNMCLRKIPAYISGRQQWEREDAETRGEKATFNPSEVSFGIYRELESIGALDGYRHLRTVARAHAVQIIADAIREGLLDVSFVGVLVKVCVALQATSEADQILESATDVEYPRPSVHIMSFADDRALGPLRLLVTYGDAVKREPFALQAISRLIESERLPHDWLLSDCWRSLWLTAIRVLCRKTVCERTIAFATTTLSILSHNITRKPSVISQNSSTKSMAAELANSPQKALLSAVSPLATILVIGQEAISLAFNSSTQNRISAVRQRIKVILHCCIADLRKKRGAGQRSCIFLLLLTLYLSEYDNTDGKLQKDARGAGAQLQKLWREPRSSQETAQQYDMVVALVGSIAQCCGRGSTIPASNYISQLCVRVQKLELQGETFEALEADSAFYLAARTNDLRDLAFAEMLDSSRTSRRTNETHQETTAVLQDSPVSPKNMFTGYRWEEGISEWVIASPPTAPQRPTLSISSHQGRISAATLLGVSSKEISQQTVSTERVLSKQKVSRPVTYRIGAIPALAYLTDELLDKPIAVVGTPRRDSFVGMPDFVSSTDRKTFSNHEQGCRLRDSPYSQELPVSRSSSRNTNDSQFLGMANDSENTAKRRRTMTGLPPRECERQIATRKRPRLRREVNDSSRVFAGGKKRRWTYGPAEQSSDDELCL